MNALNKMLFRNIEKLALGVIARRLPILVGLIAVGISYVGFQLGFVSAEEVINACKTMVGVSQ